MASSPTLRTTWPEDPAGLVLADDAIRIMGSKTELLRMLIAGQERASAAAGVPRRIPKWRAENNEDGHYSYAIAT